ncbi:MAG: hypothetical protein ACW99U_19620 [Candidatus Thorarchaeota archaeon]|jgi:hypothetical protein
MVTRCRSCDKPMMANYQEGVMTVSAKKGGTYSQWDCLSCWQWFMDIYNRCRSVSIDVTAS